MKELTEAQKDKLRKAGFKEYVKTATVFAKQMDKEFKCNTLEGDGIKGKKDDFLVVGISGEVWPVDNEIFEKTYKEL